MDNAREEYRQLASKITPLQHFVEELTQRCNEIDARYADALKLIKEKDKIIQNYELIKYQYDQLQRLVYARSTEKSTVTPGQLLLELDAEKVEACNINEGQRVASYTKLKPKNENHPGRNQIPAYIPRKYVELYPANLPEDAELIDTIESEQLEYDPARIFATVYRRYKYKRTKQDGSTEFFMATLPEEKDKSIAAPSLKAHLVTEKFVWHSPIHRQMQKFAQSGIIISENTMGDWINGTCRSLTAVYDALRSNIVKPACGYMQADETHITVLDSDKGKGKKSHIGYMWTYCNPVDKLVFFEYQQGRGNKHARPVLQNYKGYLHTDDIMYTNTTAVSQV